MFLLHLLSAARPEAHIALSFNNVLPSVSSERTAPGRSTSSAPIAVSSLLIKRQCRHAEWRRLESEGVLEVGQYSRERRLCRTFRVAGSVLHRFAEAGPTATTVARDGLVDLRDGRPTTRRIKSIRTGRGRNPLPAAVRAAMDAVGPVPWNPRAVERHLGRLRRAAEAAPAGTQRVAATARYVTDTLCYQSTLAQGAYPVTPGDPDGLWLYRPAYRAQKFGRLSQIKGGLQSCSKAMKKAAYEGVAGFKNYDLRASQALILVVLFDEAGLSPAWLTAYASEGKAAAAARIGIPVDVWKTILYATMMGANVPSPGHFHRSRGTVARAIREAVGPDEAKAVYERFLEFTRGLRDTLRSWHKWLDTEFVAANGKRNNADGHIYLSNEVGSTVALSAFSELPYCRRAQLAAFQLQGRESALVHALAASAGEFGFVVVSHEHDGLAVQGKIPAAAVERAAKVARLPTSAVFLDEKPFV